MTEHRYRQYTILAPQTLADFIAETYDRVMTSNLTNKPASEHDFILAMLGNGVALFNKGLDVKAQADSRIILPGDTHV